MQSRFACGAARVEITADPSWYPLYAGFFGPEPNTDYLVGALDSQYARAIAVRNAETTLLLVSMDVIGIPSGPQMVAKISEATGVACDNVFLIATHTHNVPALGHGAKLSDNPGFQHFATFQPEIAAHQLLYEARVWDGVVEAARQAVAALRPAKMGIGYAKSYVNVNRDQIYEGNGKYHMGYNAEGHSDKTLSLIKFVDEQEKTIAVFANYAVHAIVLFLNRCIDGKGGSTGDLPGVVCSAYEENHPGTVCMWSPGANGNQNPIIMAFYGYPDFATGDVVEGRALGAYEFLTVLAGRHHADLLRAERSITEYEDTLSLRCVREVQKVAVNPSIPPRFPTDNPNVQDIYTTGVMLNDIFLYGIGGELYSTIGAHLKEISPCKHTLICSQCYTSAGYMMDDEHLLAPTLFAQRTRWLPNTLVPTFEGFLRRFTGQEG